MLQVLSRTPGSSVVAEAATDVIAHEQALGEDEPWNGTEFVDAVLALQRRRQDEPPEIGVRVQLYDRSPVCTLALARWLGRPASAALAGEDSLAFGQVHREVYAALGYELVEVPAAEVAVRTQLLESYVDTWA